MNPEQIKSQLSNEDYEKMSRSAKRISQEGTKSFMEAFKKSNPKLARQMSKQVKETK